MSTEALRLLPVDGVAVALRGGQDNAQLIHATDPIIAQLHELQFTLGEGPCIDAYRHRHPVLTADLNDPDALQTWPGFTPEAGQTGAAAAFAFPLHIATAPFGTVELYRHRPGPLTAEDLTTALLITETMISTVLDELAGLAQLESTPTTPNPLFGRPEIPQATGMLSIQLGVTLPEALAQLRAAAYADNQPILGLAQAVIARRITFRTNP